MFIRINMAYCDRNVLKFLSRQVWANNVDQDQTSPLSSLIRVYTICHLHFCMGKPPSLNYRVITANDLGVQIF